MFKDKNNNFIYFLSLFILNLFFLKVFFYTVGDLTSVNAGEFRNPVFPEIIFNSSQIEIGDTSYTATGTLFMLGVEKEITVNFMYKGKGKNDEGKPIIIFQGEFTLDRTEHGMEETSGIGNNVEVSFYTELVEKE